MADYSFFDENFDSYLPDGGFAGFPSDFQIPDIDLSSFNWSDIDLGIGDYGFDLGSYGDLAAVDLIGDYGGNIDLSSLGDSFGFDLTGVTPNDYRAVDFPGLADFGIDVGLGGSTDAEAQEGGFYGNTPTATYDPKTNVTTIRNADGTTRTIQGPPTTTQGGGGTTKLQDIIKTVTQFAGNKDNALLMAMLGGLLGLLSRGSAPKGPVGYKGDIPKYTATRGQAVSPTEGGRRPGGAGIPSLTGGVTYQRAAEGGLMGMAAGGRPARYLRGGTDGMADKIKTNIDGKQPARLSHGEFVIPADVVSHLGNGNSDAGADVLYDMMDKVRKARTGTTKQGKQINPRKYTPA
jgi:hypothetical protein